MTTDIFRSDGMALRFEYGDNDIMSAYEQAIQAAEIAAYKALRARHGIWASNQGKYVKTRAELNEWDSKYMENLCDD